MKKNIHKKEKGFLMIEAAISVFVVGVTLGAFVLVLSGVYKSEFDKRDYLIAANLAQEGIEIVRNLRDNNWKSGYSAFDATNFPSDGCSQRDFIGNKYGNCSPANNLNLDASYFYEYGSGTASRFKRTITISTNADGSKKISSAVTWSKRGGADLNITIDDSLYPWADKE